MSAKSRRALKLLCKSVKTNSPVIRRKLARAGVRPDAVLVLSAAKYYPALKKLAKG
jgi:hypothetical protein